MFLWLVCLHLCGEIKMMGYSLETAASNCLDQHPCWEYHHRDKDARRSPVKTERLLRDPALLKSCSKVLSCHLPSRCHQCRLRFADWCMIMWEWELTSSYLLKRLQMFFCVWQLSLHTDTNHSFYTDLLSGETILIAQMDATRRNIL